MEVPSPGPELETLKRMVGAWEGQETLHPSPWDPKGGEAIGHIDARLALDGFAIVSDYAQEKEGRITFRGHGIYTWDARRKSFVMTWFDSMSAGSPGIAHGVMNGTTLTFQNQSEFGHGRYIYDFDTSNSVQVPHRVVHGREVWTMFMDARYVKR